MLFFFLFFLLPLFLPLLLPVSALPFQYSHEAGADDNDDVIPPLPGDVSNCTLCASGHGMCLRECE